jgi:2-phospho-L-lactate/phosphoenolpyruvate guanylyltransferase
MRTIAILPVKSFGAAKQRLATEVGGGARQALAQSMFSDVLGALRHVHGIESIAVVTADRVAESAAFGERVQVLRDTEEAGQSQAAAIGVRHALGSGFERALLVPGDTPLLDAAEIDELLVRSAEKDLRVVIVPDRHGSGTNALLLSPPDAMDPSFGPDSLKRHRAAAEASGLPHAVAHVPSLSLDVDTPEDLSELAGLLEHSRGTARMTKGALMQLDRSRLAPPPIPADEPEPTPARV